MCKKDQRPTKVQRSTTRCPFHDKQEEVAVLTSNGCTVFSFIDYCLKIFKVSCRSTVVAYSKVLNKRTVWNKHTGGKILKNQ